MKHRIRFVHLDLMMSVVLFVIKRKRERKKVKNSHDGFHPRMVKTADA